MKLLFGIPFSVALISCASYEYVPVQSTRIATGPDPAAHIMLQCDRLGFPRGSDGHRLCSMRGIDRLKVDQSTGYAPIQILPYPYPPLAPGGTPVPVYPYPGIK